MTLSIYLAQVLLVVVMAQLLLLRKSWILRSQTFLWGIAVAVIAIRYGITDQLNFYSNDQRFHVQVVMSVAEQFTPIDLDWISTGRLPFVLPGWVLYAFGLSPTLALKTVSLVCLLRLTDTILKVARPATTGSSMRIAILTACGTMGVFFSSLALRETMMMLVTTRLMLSRSLPNKLVLFLIMFLLRSHLAVSLAAAYLLVTLWKTFRNKREEGVISTVCLLSFSSTCGYLLYSLGQSRLFGVQVFGHSWGIEPVTRIISNYVGLQFLTVNSETIQQSITTLLLLRLVLFETVLVPTLFTWLVLTRPHLLSIDETIMMVGFAIYVGLVTNTDFNSFRQNIPFMPVMGLCAITILNRSKSKADNEWILLSPAYDRELLASASGVDERGVKDWNSVTRVTQ